MNNAWYHPDLDKIYRNKISENAILLTNPFNICFQINRYCNFGCDYCISDSSSLGDRDASWVVDALTRLKELNLSTRIVWSGGEPMLDKSIESIIDRSSSFGFTNVITTNGSKYNPISSLNWIDISVYGGTDEQYYSNTKMKNSDLVWRNIEKYLSFYNGRVSVSILLGIIAKEEVCKLAERASNIGVKKIRFQRPLSTVKVNFNDSDINEQIKYLRSTIGHIDGLSFPNSISSEEKKNGYYFITKGGMLSNFKSNISLYSPNEIVTDFFKENSEQHYNMFVTDLGC